MNDHLCDQDVPAERDRSMQHSMHNGVPVWCDCCSCEAEPYWTASGAEAAADIPSSTADNSPGQRPPKR